MFSKELLERDFWQGLPSEEKLSGISLERYSEGSKKGEIQVYSDNLFSSQVW